MIWRPRVLEQYAVRCDRPAGCGWWWVVIPVRPPWRWRTAVNWYYGPCWPGGGNPRAITEAGMIEFADCLGKLVAHPLSDMSAWFGEDTYPPGAA